MIDPEPRHIEGWSQCVCQGDAGVPASLEFCHGSVFRIVSPQGSVKWCVSAWRLLTYGEGKVSSDLACSPFPLCELHAPDCQFLSWGRQLGRLYTSEDGSRVLAFTRKHSVGVCSACHQSTPAMPKLFVWFVCILKDLPSWLRCEQHGSVVYGCVWRDLFLFERE